MITFIIIAGWIACFIVEWGLLFPFFQEIWTERAYHYRIMDLIFSIVISMGGPISLPATLIVVFIDKGYKGFRWWYTTPKPEKINYELWDK